MKMTKTNEEDVSGIDCDCMSARLPRTIMGVGGIRLINLPGVIHSESFLKSGKGLNKLTGKPYKIAPENSITTREVAKLLKRTLSSTYNLLKKKKITCYYVESGSGKIHTYWNRHEIRKLEKALPRIAVHVSKEFVSAREALNMLNVVRSTLYRYVIRGKLREIRRRIMTTRGYRHQSLFLRSEVMQLVSWRRARELQKISWEEYSEQLRTIMPEEELTDFPAELRETGQTTSDTAAR